MRTSNKHNLIKVATEQTFSLPLLFQTLRHSERTILEQQTTEAAFLFFFLGRSSGVFHSPLICHAHQHEKCLRNVVVRLRRCLYVSNTHLETTQSHQ